MGGAVDSKILVTTRLTEVTKIMSVDTSYFLRGLSTNQSLTLFKKIAFGENAKTIDRNLISIGEQIVDKCGGVPLAIRALGSLLRTKNGENEWLSILHGDIWRLNDDNTQRVMAVLKLSYKHLPIELRQCFAYCCLYPKDWKIEKDEMVQLWMAQGYLECSTETKCMEDVGNDYVKILLMRSFFQDVEMDPYGDIRCFKMHDLMHDLAMLVSGEDFYFHGDGRRTIGTATHFSLFEGPSVPFDSVAVNRARTYFCPVQSIELSSSIDYSIIQNCQSLRVLKLGSLNFSIRKLPESIGRLKHLRYLDISKYFQLKSLPKSISNLVHLQTLKLHGSPEFEFSSSITKLISLRHLEYCVVSRDIFLEKIYRTPYYFKKMPTGLGKLTSLQTLEYFLVSKNPKFAKLNELKDLNNLRGYLCVFDLGLIKHADFESKHVNLKEKKYLQSLVLEWGKYNQNVDSLILLENLRPPQNLKELALSSYPGIRYPSWICSLTNVVTISIQRCHHLPRLDHLPLLKHLDIGDISGDAWCEYTSSFSSSSMTKPITAPFFPSLTTLFLTDCRQKEHVFLPPFPCLSSLSVTICSELNCMPTFPHVEILSMLGCTIKPLIDTLNMIKEGNSNSHSSSFTPLHALKDLELRSIDPLILNLLPEDWMENLISLESLYIGVNAHMFRSLHHLPAALEKLSVKFFDKDDLYEAYKIEEVKTHGQPLHCVCSLQQINVDFCSYMRELPEWIWNNPSLREMTIMGCWNLELLPEGMNTLTNLQTLRIRKANSELYERCQRQRSADWPKIDHIPYIEVNSEQI